MNQYTIHDKYLSISWLDGIHQSVHDYLNHRARNRDGFLVPLPHQTYVCTLFTKEWCDRINRELHRYDDWLLSGNRPQSPPNSMHEYGVILTEIGFAKVLEELTQLVILPLISHLYPEVNSHNISNLHAFSVQYGAHGDRDLGFHVDASEVTVNICLGESWEGGELYFQGRRCSLHRQERHRPEEHFEYTHIPGEMLIHAGKHRHGVHPLRSGFRRNIIIWYSTGEYVEDEECPSWCQHNP